MSSSTMGAAHGPDLITLGGTPYEIGRSHGCRLQVQIGDFLDSYLRLSSKVLSTPYKALREYGERYVPHLDADYLEELRGLADGAGLELRDVLALNTFVDTCEGRSSAKVSCINMVAFGPQTTDGSLIHGRNTDFPSTSSFPRNAVVFAVYPRKGHAFLSVSWAGFAGVLTGMNSAGLTVTEVGFLCPEVRLPGVPITLLMRRIMQYAGTLEEAQEIVKQSERTAGFNLAVTDCKQPNACAIEFTARRCGVREANGGLLVVSDNRLSPTMARGQFVEPCGVARYVRAAELMERNAGRIDVATMRQMLADQFDVLERTETGSYNCPCSTQTIQSVVFVPERQQAWVSHHHIPAPFGEYRLYQLAERCPTPGEPRQQEGKDAR